MSSTWVFHFFAHSASFDYATHQKRYGKKKALRVKAFLKPRGPLSNIIAREPEEAFGHVLVRPIVENRIHIPVFFELKDRRNNSSVSEVQIYVEGAAFKLPAVILPKNRHFNFKNSVACSMGDPERFTFSNRERKLLKSSIFNVAKRTGVYSEPIVLTGEEMSLNIINGTTNGLSTAKAREEVCEQLVGASRGYPWSYLISEDSLITVSDCQQLLQSGAVDPDALEIVSALGETIVRAIGLKPGHWRYEFDNAAMEYILWALISTKQNQNIEALSARLTHALYRISLEA